MTTDNTEPTNGTPIAELARVLYEQNRGKEGRPWEHTNATTREKWEVRAAKKAAEHAVELSKPKPPGTRKYEIGAVPLDTGAGHEIEIQLPRGTVVRMITWVGREQRIALQNAKTIAIPAIIVEVDPMQPMEPRRFAVLRAGSSIETHHGMVFVGAALDPTDNGRPVCVYEVQQAAAPEMFPTQLHTPTDEGQPG